MILITDLDGSIVDAFNGKTAEVVDNNLFIDGKEKAHGFQSNNRNVIEIPDQDLSHLCDDSMRWSGTYPDDIDDVYSDGRRLEMQFSEIDRQTGENIDLAVHESCPTSEQIGMLRNMCVIIGNELGIEFPEYFAAWNKTAITAIEEGQDKKESLLRQLR